MTVRPASAGQTESDCLSKVSRARPRPVLAPQQPHPPTGRVTLQHARSKPFAPEAHDRERAVVSSNLVHPAVTRSGEPHHQIWCITHHAWHQQAASVQWLFRHLPKPTDAQPFVTRTPCTLQGPCFALMNNLPRHNQGWTRRRSTRHHHEIGWHAYCLMLTGRNEAPTSPKRRGLRAQRRARLSQTAMKPAWRRLFSRPDRDPYSMPCSDVPARNGAHCPTPKHLFEWNARYGKSKTRDGRQRHGWRTHT